MTAKVVQASKKLKLPKKAPPASTHPYMTVRKYGEPRYHRSYQDALSTLSSDVKHFRDNWARLGITDGVRACDVALDQISHLSVMGGPVHAVIDPYTQTVYQADLVRRKDIS